MRYSIVCLCPWLLLAQAPVPQPNPQPSPSKPEDLCTIEGVVRHAGSGAAVRKASVTLVPMDMRRGGMPGTTSTNAEGRFAMNNLEPGQYRLNVQKPGFVSAEYGAARNRRQGATLTLEKGQSMKGLEVKLTPHSVITGRVVDEEGDPVMGAAVMLSRYMFMEGKKQLMPAGHAQTNDLGEYRIFGVAAGKYYLSAQGRMNMGWSAVDRSAAREPDQDYVATYYPGTNEIESAVRIEVPLAATVQGMDVRMRQMRTFRIRGKVAGVEGGSSRGGMVMLGKKGDAETFPGFDRNMSGWRGPDGIFELRGIRPGSYIVRASYFEPPNQQQSGSVPVEVTDADVEGVVVHLAPGAEVTGTVRLEGEGQLPSGDLTVYLESRTSRFMMMGNTSARVKDGAFSIPNIPPDHYNVRLNGTPPEYYLKSIRLADTDVQRDGLDVRGAAAGLEIVLRAGAPKVDGSVADDKGNPVRGAAVVLRSKSGEPAPRFVSSDQNGRFEVGGLQPGEYQLLAFDGADRGEALDPDLFKEHINKAGTVKLEENAKETRQLKVIRLEER